jgi:threonine aldolase
MSFAVFRRGISHRIRTRLFSSGNTNSSKRRINGEQQQQQRSSPSLAFASDNTAGVDPRIFAALQRADSAEETYLSSYAYDRFTNAAVDRFKENFGSYSHALLFSCVTRASSKFSLVAGQDIDVHFVFGGTAGDVLAISGSIDVCVCVVANTCKCSCETYSIRST